MRNKIIVLAAIFVLLGLLGLSFNLQRGLMYADQFWRLEKDGAYRSPGGDSIAFSPETGFSLSLGGQLLTAQLHSPAEDVRRIDFSDGVSLERTADPLGGAVGIQIGSFYSSPGVTYILEDISALALRFAPIAETERHPFYDENGATLGEAVYHFAASGELIDSREIWLNAPEYTTPEKEVVTLRDGVRLESVNTQTTLYQNEAGDYLLNPDALMMIRFSDAWYSRGSLMNLMLRAAQGEANRRGHPLLLIPYAFFYLLGALGFLFPEKMAFFGSRWKFKTEPELSDDGLIMTQIGNLLILVLAAVMLFLPLFT